MPQLPRAPAPPIARPLGWLERASLWAYGLGMRLARPLLRRKLARRAASEPGYAHAVQTRFGVYNTAVAAAVATPTGHLVWVHAVSLGEARAAATLLPALREALPGMRLLLTHSTATGWTEGSRHLLPGDAQTWLPWDDPAAVQGFLHHFCPDVGVLVETEIWPCLVQGCQRAGVPLALVNARLNERSWRQGQRLRWLSRPTYAGLSAVFAQTPRDAERLASLGARVQGVWGNLKFDARPDAAQRNLGQRWRQRLARPVVLLASSREGEEALFLKEIKALSLVYKEKSATDFGFSSIQWVLVPRHPQRFAAVAQLVEDAGWPCERRDQWAERLARGGDDVPPVPASLWLGDSLGEMALYYSLADVALLGGSFEPLGGQNLIEAAACGCPVVMGPHTFNFADAADQAEATGAARRVADMAHGLRAALAWVADPGQRQAAVAAAERFSASHQGAAVRTAAGVAALLAHAQSDLEIHQN